jgi:hypothetical protein
MNNGISRLEGSWITRRGTSINKKRKLIRLSHFRRIVNSDEETVVNLHELATLALRGSSSVGLLTKGIPDENSLRPRTWKLLLRWLPPRKNEWEDFLYEKRAQYYVPALVDVNYIDFE